MRKQRPLEMEILSLYAHDPSTAFSIHQISKKLRRAYPNINKKMTRLIDERIFVRNVVGRSHLCRPDLHNDRTRLLLASAQLDRKSLFLQENGIDPEEIETIASLEGVIACIALLHEKRIIVVGASASLPRTLGELHVEAMDRNAFLDRVRTAPLFEHVVLFGFERFYALLAMTARQWFLPEVAA